MSKSRACVCLLLIATVLSSLSYAVTPDRIAGVVDPSNMVALKNHVSPMARPQFDQGPVESSRTLQVTMLFTPSAQQEQALEKLLADQQDSKSANFHKWLKADQYADRFGVSRGDIEKVSAWLQGQGFKITYVAKGRDFLSFEGNAVQVQSVFRTELHYFNVNGKVHFANVTPPMIPAVLGGIVGGFRGLHDFFPHSMLKKRSDYTFTVTGQGTFTALAPGDLATIYNINPLYQAATPIDGTGQKVAIAGQSDVYLADLNDFRSGFGLPTISGCTTSSGVITACSSTYFQMVVPDTGSDPGLSSGDLGESDLDIETMSAVARKAQILFVTSSQGVDDSASWVIDNQLAPVISYSYGLCEAFVTAPSIAAVEVEYKKAAALGISFFAASGDAGAATCDGDVGSYPAILGLSVSYPASSAYITGVGGTEFNEGSGTYWSSSNSSDGGSATSYIPELAWNDTALSVANGFGLDGTGGGASNCANGTGTTVVGGFAFEICSAAPGGGFPKPTWQSGLTPNDSVRDVPDISFSASNANDPYIVCAPQSEVVGGSVSTSTCSGGINSALTNFFSAFGGTSASTPVAAGMAVLLNQYLGANGLGNINPQLYSLYSANPTGVFHDTTTGTSSITGATSDNVVACSGATPSFEPSTLRCPGATGTTGSFGYSVAGGHQYSAVTGLGSVDFDALFTAWAASQPASSITITPSATNVQVGTSVTFTVAVTPVTGVGTVSFATLNNGTTTVLGTAILNLPYPPTTTGTAAFSTTALPGGTNNVTATYQGDAVNASSTSAPAVITVIAPDFTLAALPISGSVVAGHTTSASTITVTPVNGFNQTVTFSCTSPPTGVACNFNPQSVTPDGTNPITTSLTISTAASIAAASGTSITINASGSGVSHTASYALTVTTPTDQSFTLTPTAATITVKAGSPGSTTITVAPTNGFNTALTFTCTDTASESTCSMSPSTATTQTTVTLNITTTAPTAELRMPLGHGSRIFYAALLPGLLGIMFTMGSRRRSLRGMRLLGLILMLGFSTLWLGSCGGNSGGTKNPGTPPGNYNITVNATTGGANPVSNSSSPLVVQLTVTQ